MSSVCSIGCQRRLCLVLFWRWGSLRWSAGYNLYNLRSGVSRNLSLVRDFTASTLVYTDHTQSSITSVGGTQGVSPEIAASLSSGGFSNYFPRPSYQDDAVSAYLKTLGSTNAGLFNATSRGFPDVAAPAENVTIVWEGQSGNVAGTSCASPIFASIVALINDQLIAAGENPLGFLNPLIYKSPDAFNDITFGKQASSI